VCEQAIRQLGEFWRWCGLPAGRWPEALAKCRRYWGLIRAHNARARLTAVATAEEFYLKHVADSLAVLLAWPELFAGPGPAADVGSGAGLPGVVLALALPALRLTAVEANRKKAAFIALAADELGLAGRVHVAPRTSRELAKEHDYTRRFAVVTARAVAPAEKLIRNVRGLLAPAGSAVLYKTPPAVEAELPLARREAGRHKLRIEVSGEIALPAGAGRRQLLRVVAPG